MGPLVYLARPERLIQIALGRSSPLRGASGVQNARAFCRTGALIFIPTHKIKKGPRWDPFVYLARPERFELPTTWFEAKYSIQLSYGRIVSICSRLQPLPL